MNRCHGSCHYKAFLYPAGAPGNLIKGYFAENFFRMGELELVQAEGIVLLHADLFFYGDAADEGISRRIASDVSLHWNEADTPVIIGSRKYRLEFRISGTCAPGLRPLDVLENDNPRSNYFRVEDHVIGNISFVDAIGSNTGYFKRDNLLQSSSTAAHEFGHTIGLAHPDVLDIRGGGLPGIMYPRGTLVDARYQYSPSALPGAPGGTLNPHHRRVLPVDIHNLGIHRLHFNPAGRAVIGAFSSVWHDAHPA
jgi:hypothetical protein